MLILRLRTVMTMDSSALNALEGLHQRLGRRGVRIVLSGAAPNVQRVMERAGFIEQIGRENLAPNIDAALEIARRHLGPSPKSTG